MAFSTEIKDYLKEEIQKKRDCCKDAFGKGRYGVIYTERCPNCRSAFISGVFTGFGTVTDPEKDYHLEIKASERLSEKVEAILIEEGIEPKLYEKDGKRRLCYKVSGAIGDFLTFIGASRFALEVMETEVMKSVRNDENRRSNAEIANIDRAATAAAEQLLAIGILRSCGALESLPDELKTTACLREEHPEASLSELAAMFSPPISKSGLSHRFKKLMEEARRIRSKQ